jgi:hypothetical protein
MHYKVALSSKKLIQLTAIAVSCIYSFGVSAQPPANPVKDPSTSYVTSPQNSFSASDWRAREGVRFQRNWGVDITGVRPSANGLFLALRYRVVDPEKARILNDKRSKAYVIDEATGNVLGVPIMENLGELRQKDIPQFNRSYFIMFGNPGKLVKSGSKISLVIGEFRADGMIVD